MWRKTLMALGVVLLLVALRYMPLARRVEPPVTLRLERPLMGTLWSIEVAHHGRIEAARVAVDQAFAEVKRIEALMSEWRPDSPLSAINAAAGRQPVAVPEELRAILERANHYSSASQGAFDATWRGMGSIWRLDDAFVPPGPEAIAKARRNVDYRALRIDGDRVFLSRAGMSIGLGGIAKGYAVDRAAKVLRTAGFPDSLVAGAGDILASGARDAGTPWSLGIQDPRRERGVILGSLPLSAAALSTSGDYERFRIVNGVRYHHIIDPRTGAPAARSISVSVIAPTAEQSDALATAIFILGPENGLALARAEKVEALVIDPRGRRHATAGFPPLTAPAADRQR